MAEHLQEMIYLFNEEWLRKTIINFFIKQNNRQNEMIWKDTIYCKKHNNQIICNDKQSFKNYDWGFDDPNKIYLFTIAYIYKENYVHHVSFIYHPHEKQLACFDPGYNLYLYGYYKIIPMTINLFKQKKFITNNIILKAPCHHKYFKINYGIQYDGENPHNVTLPADAFCQMWTIYFLTTYIQYHHLDFFRDWCDISPSKREYFIISTFLIPVIAMTPRLKKYRKIIPSLQQLILKDVWKII